MTERPAGTSAVALQSETTFRCSGAPMCIADPSLHVIATNAAFEARLGPCRDRALPSFFVHPPERERAAEQLAALHEDGSSAVLRGECATGGVPRVLRWSCRLVERVILAVVEDVTEQLAAQDELARKTAELDALLQALPGASFRLVRHTADFPRASAESSGADRRASPSGQSEGTAAHDFNNMLTVILGQLQFLRRSPTLTEADGQYVKEAFEATEQAVLLTRRLIASGRGREVASVALGEEVLLSKSRETLDAE